MAEKDLIASHNVLFLEKLQFAASYLRLFECTQMLVPGVTGVVLRYGIHESIRTDVLLFVLASFFHLLFAYTHNDACDFDLDLRNPRKRGTSRKAQETLYRLSGVFLILSFVFLAFLPFRIFLLFLCCNVLCFAYSRYHLRVEYYIPFGQIAHFLCGAGYFISGVTLFDPTVTLRLAFGALFFGLAYMAGGLFNEVIDYRTDKDAGLRTFPVVVDRGLTLRLIPLTQLVALVCLIVLYSSLFTRCFVVFCGCIYVVYLLDWARSGWDEEKLSAFRVWYRSFFCLTIFGSLFLELLFQ